MYGLSSFWNLSALPLNLPREKVSRLFAFFSSSHNTLSASLSGLVVYFTFTIMIPAYFGFGSSVCPDGTGVRGVGSERVRPSSKLCMEQGRS